MEEKPQETQKKKRSEEQISKYRELLKNIQSKEKRQQEDMEMEISWVPGTRRIRLQPLGPTAERLIVLLLRSEGNGGAAGEEEAGGQGPADALGGVSAEEEGEEEAEEK